MIQSISIVIIKAASSNGWALSVVVGCNWWMMMMKSIFNYMPFGDQLYPTQVTIHSSNILNMGSQTFVWHCNFL